MELGRILTMPIWTPLAEVVDQIRDDNMIRGRTRAVLYRLGADAYLAVTPIRARGQDVEEGTDGPYVAGVMWATSEGAARRAWFLEIEADEGTDSDIPGWCMPEGVAPRFGDIAHALGSSAMQFASYRIASDGKFVCRNIESRAYHYCFRGRGRNDSEPPFVAVRKLLERGEA